MKHLFYLAVVVALGLAIFTFAAGLEIDVISMGREIMTAGWSLAGALGF